MDVSHNCGEEEKNERTPRKDADTDLTPESNTGCRSGFSYCRCRAVLRCELGLFP